MKHAPDPQTSSIRSRRSIGRLPWASRLRRISTGLALFAMTVLVGLGSATAAHAETSAYSQVSCGWYMEPGALSSFVDYKVSLTTLPQVTATLNGPEHAWVHVQFMHPDGGGGTLQYRDDWLYTYVSSGSLSTTWTQYSTGISGLTAVHDLANGMDSGYTGAEFTSLDTYVYQTIYWMNGTVVTDQVSEWAVAPNNANNGYVCNGGGGG